MSITQKGFSLPEIIIAIGLLAGISLVTMKVIDNQANNEARIKASAEIQKTVAIIKGILNNTEQCRGMLKDQPLSTAVNGATDIIKPPALSGTYQPGLYQRVRNSSDGTFSYKEILAINSNYGKFRIGGPGSIQLVKVTDSNTNVDAIDLVIRFRLETKAILFRDDGNNVNDKTLIQRIPLLVTFNNAVSPNVITDCGLVVSDANLAAKEKLCRSMGSMASWTGTDCTFVANQCPPGQVPERQNPTGTLLNCVNLEDQMNVLDLFNTTYSCSSASGSYRIISSGTPAKLRIECY